MEMVFWAKPGGFEKPVNLNHNTIRYLIILEKQGSVRLGYESPGISPSPRSFFVPGFPFYQVYLTISVVFGYLPNLAMAYRDRYCVRDCKGSVPILHRYRSEAEPWKARPLRSLGNAQISKAIN